MNIVVVFASPFGAIENCDALGDALAEALGDALAVAA